MTNTSRSVAVPPAQERGGVLGFVLITVLVGLMAVALRAGPGTKDVLMGAYLMLWGFLFLASYFFSHKTFFLRGLRWVCMNLSYPGTPKIALFYFVVAVAMGAALMLTGLGKV